MSVQPSLAIPWPPARGFLVEHLLALFAQMPGHFLEHPVEQRIERLVETMAEDAVLLGLLLCGLDRVGDFLVLRGMALLVPFADRDQVILEPPDRIAQRPGIGFARAAILRGIIARRMTFGAIGEMLDQRRAAIGPRPNPDEASPLTM